MDGRTHAGRVREGYQAIAVTKGTVPFFILILLGSTLLRLPHFDAPFIRPHEDDNARYGLAARNHLRFGLGTTLAGHLLTPAGHDPRRADFYPNHPGTFTLLVAASLLLFGESEGAVRIVPLLFSLAAVVIFCRAVSRRWPRKTALIATTAFAFMPGFLYYGKMATFLPIILPLGIWIVDRFGRGATPWIAVFFACLVDYGAFLILPAVLLAYPRDRRIVQIGIAGAVAFLLVMLQILLIGGVEGMSSVWSRGLSRAGGEQNVFEFMKGQALDHFPYALATPIGAILALLGIPLVDRRPAERRRFLAALVLWGLLYVAVFNDAARVHDYWQFYLIPAAAILIALSLTRAHRALAAIGLIVFLDQSVRILNQRYYADTAWYAYEFSAIEFARMNARAGDTVRVPKSIRTTHPAYYVPVRFEFDPTVDTFTVSR